MSCERHAERPFGFWSFELPIGFWSCGPPFGALRGPGFEATFGFGRGGSDRDPSYAILDALGEAPEDAVLTGYEILEALRRRGAPLHEAIVYPTLQMLEDMGYVERVEAEGRRAYRITAEGREYRARHEREPAASGDASTSGETGPGRGRYAGRTGPFVVFGRCGCRL